MTALDSETSVRPRTQGATEGFLSRASAFLSTAAVAVMILVAIMTTIDIVIMRAILNRPIAGLNEVFATIFATAIAALLASGLAGRSTLEIDVLADRLGPARAARLRSFGAMFYCAVLVALAIGVVHVANGAYVAGSTTTIMEISLWPFYAATALLIGMCVPIQFLTALRLSHKNYGAVRTAFVDLALLIGLYVALYVLVRQGAPLFAEYPIATSIIILVSMWVMMMLLLPVAACLIFASSLGIYIIFGASATTRLLGSETMSLLGSADFAVIPYFLIMGSCAVACGMSADVYRFAHAVFSPLRGGLALATIGGCAGFGALTGSSIATVATIGSVSYPEMKSKGYSTGLATGSIAAGGTLGQLIPPSTAVVVYAILVQQSIGALYVAMIVPAVLTILFYMIAVLFWVYRGPEIAPASGAWNSQELIASFIQCIPTMVLFGLVFGGVFFGVFTVNEAAACGAMFAFSMLVIRSISRQVSLTKLIADTTGSVSMIYFLIIGGLAFTFYIATVGLQEAIVGSLIGLDVHAWVMIAIISLVLIALGTIFDSMTIMMISAVTLAGIVETLGYSTIWWGVVMVVIVELGVITPPFGINLFMIKGIAPQVRTTELYKGVVPFLVADIIKLLLLCAFPVITLFLPSLMGR